MRFLQLHKAASYLMVLTSLTALIAPGEVAPLWGGLCLLAAALSWFWEPPRVDLARFETAWNLLTLAALGAVVLDVSLGGGILLGGIHFVLFLALNKLFNRRHLRDYLQLYVLSFLQMIAATVIHTDLLYGVLFLGYVVFATWALILFHLRREMEEMHLLKYGADAEAARPVQVQRVLNSRKLVGPGFLGLTSAVALVVFAGSLTLFFAFPRIGFGFFSKKARNGVTMAGFSDQIELGQFGRIKDDPTVVLRVEFPEGGRDRLAPYWRGVTFDHYDGARWRKSVEGVDCPVYADRGGRHRLKGRQKVRRKRCVHLAAPEPDTPAVAQRIYREPLGSSILFGLSDWHAVRLPENVLGRFGRRAAIRLDRLGDVHLRQLDDLAFQYTAYSRPEGPAGDALGVALADYKAGLPEEVIERYLQLPEDLSPEIRALAARLTADASTLGAAVSAVEAHLRGFRYTLDLGRDARYAPLDDFLFVQRQGHCEYFATALVILLRAAGIPARNVNGFLGGTWNSYGNYLAVRQGDAHSWAELYLGDGRWQTRDPTPAGEGRGGAGGGFLEQMRLYTDALRLRWYKYVIEYDLQDQAAAVLSLRDSWRQRFGKGGLDLRRLLGDLARGVIIAAAFGLLWWAARRLRWRRIGQDAAARQVAVAELFERLVARYARLGYLHPAHETPLEFVQGLIRRGAPGQETAAAVLRTYEAVRYAGAPVDGAALLALRQAIRQIKRPAEGQAQAPQPDAT